MSWRKEILIKEKIFTMRVSQGPDRDRDCYPGDPPGLPNLALSRDASGSSRCPNRKKIPCELGKYQSLNRGE